MTLEEYKKMIEQQASGSNSGGSSRSVGSTYSANDLTQDEFYNDIRAYMQDVAWADATNWSKQDTVDYFLNRMRGFNSGNSVRTIQELTHINNADDEAKVRAARAYEIYDNMESIFGDTTIGEKSEAAWDHTRTAILDPLNIFTFGIGKVAASGAGKSAAKLAQLQATKASRLAGGGVKGAEEGKKVFSEILSRTAAEATEKAILKRGTGEAFEELSKRKAKREIMGDVIADASFSAGVEYLRQQTLMRADYQDEFDYTDFGVTLLGSFVLGGAIGYASYRATGLSGNEDAQLALRKSQEVMRENALDPVKRKEMANNALTEWVDNNKKTWEQKWRNGLNFEEMDHDLIMQVLLGSEKDGHEGIGYYMAKNGAFWSRTSDDTTISEWITDVIGAADDEVVKEFQAEFTRRTGIETQGLGASDFADQMAIKIRKAMQTGNALSQISKMLNQDGINHNTTIAEAMTKELENLGIKVSDTDDVSTQGTTPWKAFKMNAKYTQRNIIRLIVSNPGTTALNIKGWAHTSLLNSATDVTQAILHGGAAAAQIMAGKNPSKNLNLAKANLLGQFQKARNFLDPEMTYESFQSLVRAKPQMFKELQYVLPGGVDDARSITKAAGFDPDRTLSGLKADEAVDYIQLSNGVQIQDAWTKSQEYMAQLDKHVRRRFGMGYNELTRQTDFANKLNSPEFQEAHGIAIDETLRAIYSKDFSKPAKGTTPTPIHSIADSIQKFRDIPVVGLAIPFGRFFNNVVGSMYRMSPLDPLMTLLDGGKIDDVSEKLSRVGVVWGGAYLMSQGEEANFKEGLEWHQFRDPETGEIKSWKYDFPSSVYKALSYAIYHAGQPEGIPKAAVRDIMNILGPQQLTRQLDNQTQDVVDAALALLSPESEDREAFQKDMAAHLKQLFGNYAANVAGGATRFIDPVNQVVGLVGGEQRVYDRKIGNNALGDAIRNMDYILAELGAEGVAKRPEAQSMSGSRTVQPSKLVGVRPEEMNYTKRILSLADLEGWRYDFRGKDTEAGEQSASMANQFFHDAVEPRMEMLFKDPEFRRLSKPKRRKLVREAIQDARKEAYDMMEVTNENGRLNRKRQEVIRNPKFSISVIEEALNYYEYDKEFEELTYEELDLLHYYLKNREELME